MIIRAKRNNISSKKHRACVSVLLDSSESEKNRVLCWNIITDDWRFNAIREILGNGSPHAVERNLLTSLYLEEAIRKTLSEEEQKVFLLYYRNSTGIFALSKTCGCSVPGAKKKLHDIKKTFTGKTMPFLYQKVSALEYHDSCREKILDLAARYY